MDDTPNLKLPYIAAAQSQKHVTHNEAIRALDCLVCLAVLSRMLATPPPSPADGDRYIVAAAATGAWAGKTGLVAAWQDGAWEFYAPREGWLAWISSEDIVCAFDGAACISATANALSSTPLLGINTTADTTNRLAVKSGASLFDNDGHGHQAKINKAAAGDTASILFQTGYSGRAELGLAGDDDFHVKVSADGAAWTEAIVIDRTTGAVTFPHTTIGGAAALSYAYATGDQRSNIAATTNLAMVGAISNLLRGTTGTTDTYLSSNTLDGTNYIRFDFATAKVVTELRWLGGTPANQGNWKVQGSADASAWTDLSTVQPLCFSSTNGGLGAGTASSPGIVRFNDGRAAYRYYRLLGVNGTTSPAPYIYGVEFLIGS